MKYKFLLTFVFGVFLTSLSLISAGSIPVYVAPQDGNGDLQPNTAFIYQLNFSTQTDCNSNGIVLNHTETISTASSGIGFISVLVPNNLEGIPKVLCETRNGTLRKTHNISSSFFNQSYFDRINITGTLTVNGIELNETIEAFLGNGTYTGFMSDTGDTATGNYTFDATTFFIDSTSNLVGIGTATPMNLLNVLGDSNFTGRIFGGSGGLLINWSQALNGTLALSSRTLTTGQGLTGGGDLSANRNFALAIGTNLLGWSNLTNYPSTCSSSQYISAFGDTLTCASLSITESQISNLQPYLLWSNAVNGTLAINTTIADYVRSVNDTQQAWVDNKFVTLGGDTITGTYDFNGGWESDGLSIIGGDIYAQTGYFYNITGLSVNTLAINGSIIPQNQFNNTFDLGNTTYWWRDLFLGRNAHISGTLSQGGISLNDTIDAIVGNGTYVLWGQTGNGTLMLATGDTATGNYTFDATTFFIDSTSDLVGIGTTTPNSLFETGISTQTNEVNLSNTMFVNSTSGNVSIGTATATSKLKVVGNLNVTRNLYVGGNLTFEGADYAELFESDVILEKGDVVCLDDENKISKCTKRADFSVIGVVSSNPSVIGRNLGFKNSYPVGFIGIVPVKVTGHINRFELLTTSSKQGFAEKATYQDFGAIIGKSMGSCYKKECLIDVIVGLR